MRAIPWTYALDASCAHVNNFTAVLSALRLSRRQRARVRADGRGMTFSTRDVRNRARRAPIFRADVFQSYACDETAALMHSSRHFARGVVEFDVDLGALIDVRRVGRRAGRDADARCGGRSRRGVGARWTVDEEAGTGNETGDSACTRR